MLPRACASVLAQTFTDFELLIAVDGSPADYVAFVAGYENERVRMVHLPENGGPAKARNAAIAQARGELLAFLDDDDEYAPDFLAASLALIENADERVGMSWCSTTMLDYPADPAMPPERSIKQLPARYDSDDELLSAFLAVGIGSGITIRKRAFDAVGPFNTDLAVADDSDMFLRLLRQGYWPLAVPVVGITLHNHRQPRMTDISHHEIRIRECAWLLEHHREWFARYPSIFAQFDGHMHFLRRELDAGRGSPR